LIFFLLLLVVPLCLDKQKTFTFNYQQFVKPETQTCTPHIPEKQVTAKKPAPAQKHRPIEKPVLSIHPIDVTPIQPLFVKSNCLDSTSLFADIKPIDWNVLQNYQIKKFYIPPVEYKLKLKELIIPAGLITLSSIATKTDNFRDILPIERPNPQDRLTPFDDIFQFSVAPSLFVFDAIGKEKHHPIDQFLVMSLSYGITVIPTRYLKAHYSSPRPYGGNHSFPSGHTAVAFVGAHIIYKEFKDSNAWIAYSGYAMGFVVAGARVANDKHWISDVMAGAGIAMLSTELAYLVYFPVRNFVTEEANKLFGKYIILSPVVYPNTVGIGLSARF
jgi:hypothetical protein